MVEASSNWTLRTDMARATPCVCGASKGSAFSAEVVVSAAVLVDFGGDIRASGGFRASRGGGGGRLHAPRGVGIVLWPREAVLWPREAFYGRAKLVPFLQPYGAAERRRAMRPRLWDRGDPGALYSAAEAQRSACSAAQGALFTCRKKTGFISVDILEDKRFGRSAALAFAPLVPVGVVERALSGQAPRHRRRITIE